MARYLSDYLKAIGQEIHDSSYTDDTCTIRPITKDEALAREIWKRALGYEVKTVNADGTVGHRLFPPDPKAQEFIFERREGKIVVPTDDKSTTLIDKITDITKFNMNKMAEDAVDD